MSNQKIRTRYAPSPTGKMHVGNLRTALYEFLIAKHEGGDFLLRIEDTDQERFVEGAIEIVNRTLEIAGVIYDEGPDKDGGYGPYIQSERKQVGIYKEYALQLVEKGEAYYCFCDKETLDTKRQSAENNKETYKYDKHCLHISKEEIEDNIKKNIPYVIRQSNPIEGKTTFVDEIYGEISVENSELDDMVLMKSDGYPTYNFANVVDDHLMKITHVVRGNEYLSSSPKYNRLYEAFGWDVPVYVHCPLITNEEHQKLSKRSGHASFEDLLDQGFLPEAIVNFVTLLGWSPSGSNQEIFTLDELIKNFDYKNISKSPAVFDIKKFKWMNSEYIKRMPFEQLYKIAEPFVKQVIKKENLNLEKIVTLIQSRIEVLNDIPEIVDFFEEVPDYDISLYNHKRMKTNPENSYEFLQNLLPVLDAHEEWTLDALQELVMGYVADQGIKNGQILWPLRTALSGKMSTPGGAFDLADILGKEESIGRIKAAVVKLENEK